MRNAAFRREGRITIGYYSSVEVAWYHRAWRLVLSTTKRHQIYDGRLAGLEMPETRTVDEGGGKRLPGCRKEAGKLPSR